MKTCLYLECDGRMFSHVYLFLFLFSILNSRPDAETAGCFWLREGKKNELFSLRVGRM